MPVRALSDRRVLAGAFGLLLVVAPLFSSNQYLIRLLVMSGINILLAMGLNLISGVTGQLSMGHAAFYGLGAYTSALLMLRLSVPFWFSALAAALVAGVFGVLLGIPTLRLRGDYLAITTVGLGEIVHLIFLNWDSVTNGPLGLPGIPAPSLMRVQLGSNLAYYYLVLVVDVLVAGSLFRLGRSRVGRALIAIRDDELTAETMGIDTTRLKVTAFAFSAVLAGVAGALFASYMSFISPENFTYSESVTMLLMVVLGGMGSYWGAIAGAGILTIAPEALRVLSEWRMVVYGVALVVLMIVRPQGLFGSGFTEKKPAKKIKGKASESAGLKAPVGGGD